MRLAAILGLALVLSGCAAHAQPLRDGDIIFHTSRSSQSAAIQRATHSRYSHMGMILYRDGKPFVYEAVNPVRYTPLDRWIARGEGGRYVVKRWRDADTKLDAKAMRRLRKAALRFEGRPYDLAFAWSDARIYCSELVWKAYRDALGVEIGATQRLADFDLDDPVVKAKLRERYGATIPLDETVISPQAMFDSALLVTVAPQARQPAR